MIWLQKGDFIFSPKVTLICGSDETVYACALSFEKARKTYHARGQMIIGKTCSAAFPYSPSAGRQSADGTGGCGS
jgi:hypothetical protein